ncbi:MAG: N-6 DNA methylase [Fermentimonas sp.]|nr:N-6 DNA methylase [Fermentimonas sp.]
MKRNERDWAGQLISWIKSAIENHTTIFEDATNDTGIKLDSGRTKFPDVLLFTDKVSGIIFNGWELKFPDTSVDETIMLENALEKAQKIKSNSFVTWNGAEAVIWRINSDDYSIRSLSKLKEYPKERSITTRDDLADPIKFSQNEQLLKKRAADILHDLGMLFTSGELKPAINITGNIVSAVRSASDIIVPQFQNAITSLKGRNVSFRKEFNKWKIYESSTLNILASSSRRAETVIEEQVLAKFTFYNLIGKILFYLTLCENLRGELENVKINSSINIKSQLYGYFDKAKAIDYQAIFKPYFTDEIEFSEVTNQTLFELIQVITEFDFRILPTNVIGNILENLVPKEEKQKFGQYFTPETLANLSAFPAVQTNQDYLFDPTSGTGTFLNAFYKILNYHGNNNHTELLEHIWGNDVSHFPAILSVINLYKQDVIQTNNFPRITRDDFFNLDVGDKVSFPDSQNYKNQIELEMPLFDAIASNFPFIQQEDIPNTILTAFFREKFEVQQQAFLRDNTFKINERSDYFTYCVYNSFRFLKDDGYLTAITSNAWLGKEYGFQFKKFLLDNFHIKYVVKSNAEHWFSNSQVSTIFVVLQKTINDESTKFVTIDFKLENFFSQEEINVQLSQIENFYSEIDNCENPRNPNWEQDSTFEDLYKNTQAPISVCIVSKTKLIDSIDENDNWSKYFISANLFAGFDNSLTQLYPTVIDVFRGERTGWNDMFVIAERDMALSGIESDYLIPYVKSPTELEQIEFSDNYKFQLFVCSDNQEELPIGATNWIKKFENAQNSNGTKTIQETCSGHHPYWYSLRPKKASIITAINPFERFFFTYSKQPFTIDQRLIAIRVNEGYEVELIAALLNSAITFLTLEMRGTSRNLGALDLNANYLKQLRVLNPNLLSDEQKNAIIEAFHPLKHRKIETIFAEVQKPDRVNFDKTILRCFGIDETLLESIYSLLVTSVEDRVSMKER